jgi:hypothetical protein
MLIHGALFFMLLGQDRELQIFSHKLFFNGYTRITISLFTRTRNETPFIDICRATIYEAARTIDYRCINFDSCTQQ